MNAQELFVLIGLAALVAALGDEVARQTSRRTGWLAAGPSLLLAATPLVPNHTIALGYSLDDTLPVLATAMVVPLIPWRLVPSLRWGLQPGPGIALVGILLMIGAGLSSAVVVGDGPGEMLRLAVRGPGRLLLLLTVVACLAIAGSTPWTRRWSALAIAGVGIVEAAFGLVAYFAPLPGRAGLEGARESTVLFGEIPGRISGTLGISPNFTAAILMITILTTAGLALGTADRRSQLAWWAMVVLQLGALTLTYTRVSLALVLAALVVLVLLRSRPILLVPIGAVLAVVAIFTPTLQRFVSDIPDRLALWSSAFLLLVDHPIGGVGPGQMLAAVAADPERYRMTPFGQAWSTAHNTVLLAGAETGVLGAVGAVLLNGGLAVVALRAFRSAPPGAAGAGQVAAALALGCFLVQGMVNNLFTVGVTGLFAAYLLGSLLLDARAPAEAGTADSDARAPVPLVQRGLLGLVVDALPARRRRPAQERGVRVTQDRR